MKRPRSRYGAGVAASVAAESVFIAMVAAVSAMRGMDPWQVVRLPAAFVLGPAAGELPGVVTHEVMLGLGLHLWLSIVVGLAYAALLPRMAISPLLGGVVAGAVLYGMGFWALPLLFPGWLAPFWLPPVDRALQAAAHLVYGIAFGVAYRRLV